MTGRYSADAAAYLSMDHPQSLHGDGKPGEIMLAKGDILKSGDVGDFMYHVVLVSSIVEIEHVSSMFE